MKTELKCGCIIEDGREVGVYDDPDIVFCPMHKAAPEMLEALKVIKDLLKFELKRDKRKWNNLTEYWDDSLMQIDEAIAQAEEKEGA